jgi:hypothetical protein
VVEMKSKKISKYFLILSFIFYNFLSIASSPAASSSSNTTPQKQTTSSVTSNDSLAFTPAENLSSSPAQTPDQIAFNYNQYLKKNTSSSSSTPISDGSPTPILAESPIQHLENYLKNQPEVSQLINNMNKENNDLVSKIEELKKDINNNLDDESIKKEINLIDNKIKNFKGLHTNFKNFLNAIKKGIEGLKEKKYTLIEEFNKKENELDQKLKELLIIKDKILHKEQCSFKTLSDFIKNDTLISYYDFIKTLSKENISISEDSSLVTCIHNKNLLTPAGKLYINLAHGLFHEMEQQKILDIISKFTGFTVYKSEIDQKFEKAYIIKSWNLFHVFLGSIEQQSFSGLHFNISNLFKNNDYPISSLYEIINIHNPQGSQIKDVLIFSKNFNLYNDPKIKDETIKNSYSIKRSTFFPDNMSLADYIIATIEALNNISSVSPYKDTGILNIIGRSNKYGLEINISYNSKEEKIETFFPIAKHFKEFNAVISNQNLEKFKENIINLEPTGRTFDKFEEILKAIGIFQNISDFRKHLTHIASSQNKELLVTDTL